MWITLKTFRPVKIDLFEVFHNRLSNLKTRIVENVLRLCFRKYFHAPGYGF